MSDEIKIIKPGESVSVVYLYTLNEPDTGEIRYVGKSEDVNKRLKEHIRKSKRNKTHKDNWIQSLLNQNKSPILEIYKVVPESSWGECEQKLISELREKGLNLTNIANGGEGGNLGSIVNKKISESKLGFKHSQETKDKISKFRLGVTHSKETKDKMSRDRCGENNPMYGKTRSEGSKKYRKIIQLDLEGKIIKEWFGIIIASKELNINRSTIGDVCNGRKRTAGGFKWEYKN